MTRVKYFTLFVVHFVLFACTSLEAAVETGSQITGNNNLFRNASFLQSTNQPIPDYWDLHHAAAVTFKDLHNQYFISEKVSSPVANTKTLVIVNSEKDFYHAILLPHNLFEKLPEGNYTFSVYAKSDCSNAQLLIYKAWGEPRVLAKKILSKKWERYTVTFSVNDSGPNPPQPMMYFPSKATYFVAAPQLEYGSSVSSFRASLEDDELGTEANLSAGRGVNMNATSMNIFKARREAAPLSASFEYDYYTNEDVANLDIKSRSDTDLNVHVECPGTRDSIGTRSFSTNKVIKRFSSDRIYVPLSNFAINKYTCTVSAQNKIVKKSSIPVELTRLGDNPFQVRVTNRRFLKINDYPFFIVGMEVGGRDNLPDWYFDDLAAHGINTLFFGAIRNGMGEYDLAKINNFLMKANGHGFKVVLGRPLMGNKEADWRQKFSEFKELIENLKGNPAIIAWEIVDEPAANTWNDSELMEIYRGIKQTDPYRPVFMNWAYDGVPAEIGTQPRGTLKATDFYSTDYYPFAAKDDSLLKFAQHSVRALETARLFNKMSHKWIQLYGGMDAWREPTGDELNYMVYLNLIYGGMFSYWNTKSNSATTWSRVAEINHQAKTLAANLFLNPNAREFRLPEIDGDFIFSVWKTGREFYLIALHNSQRTGKMDFDLAGLISAKTFSVRSLFDNHRITVTRKRLRDVISPYQSRVYIVTANR